MKFKDGIIIDLNTPTCASCTRPLENNMRFQKSLCKPLRPRKLSFTSFFLVWDPSGGSIYTSHIIHLNELGLDT